VHMTRLTITYTRPTPVRVEMNPQRNQLLIRLERDLPDFVVELKRRGQRGFIGRVGRRRLYTRRLRLEIRRVEPGVYECRLPKGAKPNGKWLLVFRSVLHGIFHRRYVKFVRGRLR